MPTATVSDKPEDKIARDDDKAEECEMEPIDSAEPTLDPVKQDVTEAESNEGVVDDENALPHTPAKNSENQVNDNAKEKSTSADADTDAVAEAEAPDIIKESGDEDVVIPVITKTEVDIIDIRAKTPVDPKVKEQQDLILNSTPTSTIEIALYDELSRKESHIQRLSGEIMKLKTFISKRKQTYKRKRKDSGAPTRALSAYNIFVQDRFARLAKENEAALKSADTDAQLKRVPPASLVASTGNEWKELPAEEKAYYEDRAKEDRKRYEEQMAKYQPPDKQANRKRNKTGYNMFFSAHVLRLKQSETGVPSERGSVARLVGNAWKELSADDKQYYEREADKQNGMNSGDEDEHVKEEDKRRPEYASGPPMVGIDPNIHRPMAPQMSHAHVVHQPTHHDPRVHYPPPGPPGHYQAYPGYYDYHQPPPPAGQVQRSQSRQHHPQAGGYQYHPSHYPHYHDQGQI